MPDPAPILNLIEAFRSSKVMFTLVRLGFIDRLAHSPASAEEVAAEFGFHPGALEQLFDCAVALELLQKSHGTYQLAEVAETYLRRDSPSTLAGYIRYSDAALYPLWGHLDDALREGSNRWAQTFGATAGELFSHFFRTEDAKRDFLAGMHGMGQLSSPVIVRSIDLSRFKRLADLGGATGHLAIAACQQYPALEAIVLDLPQVIPVTREYVTAAQLDTRIQCLPGDFFQDSLPPADLYTLGRILHDWTEAKILHLLRKIHDALPRGGALLICEKLLNDDKCGPLSANLQSLNMLTVTEGRERTLSEYRTLLESCGFADCVGIRTGTPLDAIFAQKQ